VRERALGRAARVGPHAGKGKQDAGKENGPGLGGLLAGFGFGLIWFFSFPSPSLFPISNQLNLFEFKFEFEFKPHSNK
jgi:hypothetical protein